MAIKIGLGISTEKDTSQATRAAIMQAKLNLKTEKAHLAIVFSTMEFVYSNAIKAINSSLGQASIIGSSSLGVISNQGISKHCIAIMLISFPEGAYFNTGCVKGLSARGGALAGEELGEKLLYGLKNMRRDLGVLFSDGLMQDEHGFFSGLQEKLGRSFPLAGAVASDNLEFKKPYVYYNGEALRDATSGLLLGGRLNFGLGIKHGWKPLGKPRYVTKAAGNTVHEIDGIPAAAIYKDYFACGISKLRAELKYISTFYPIGIYLEGEDEYLLRNIISIEDNEALNLQGNVPEGSQIRLMIGTKESCLAATKQAVEEVKKGLAGRSLSFALVFNSVSRYILLGRQANKEIEIIKEGLGKDTPVLGIYTYGEQAPLKSINYQGRAYFHNQTVTILGIAA